MCVLHSHKKSYLRHHALALFWLLVLNGCLNQRPPLAVGPTPPVFPVLNTGLDAITSFDVYTDHDKVHLIVAGYNAQNPKQIRLQYVHSEDGGQHWSPSIEVNTNAPAPIATRGNDIQLAVAGDQLLAVWQAQGELPNMGPMVSVYSTDAGKTWAVGSNPAINMSGDQAHLDLVADRQGIFHAVWLEDPEENGYQSLRYAQSQHNGVQWDKALTLDTSTCSCCWNVVQVSPHDELNVLYRDMEPRDMGLMQSSVDGKSWQRTSTVGQFNWQFDGCPHVGGALAFAGDTLHSLVWTGEEQARGLYYLRSENNGKAWTAPFRLGNKAVHGDIASTENAQIVAVWDEMEPEGTRIFRAQSQDNGVTWSSAKPLSHIGSLATHPRIVATSSGYLALWTEKPPKQPSRLGLAFFP